MDMLRTILRSDPAVRSPCCRVAAFAAPSLLHSRLHLRLSFPLQSVWPSHSTRPRPSAFRGYPRAPPRRSGAMRRGAASLACLFGKRGVPAPAPAAIRAFLDGASVEVMPRTAAKVEDFRAILAPGSRVYIAHIEGVAVEDIVATAARLAGEGFEVMPHFPARLFADTAELEDAIDRYQGEAGVTGALLLAGGVDAPRGSLKSSMDLLSTGLFDRKGFKRLHVAGHPEGSRDIDPDGSDARVMQALRWKEDFAKRTDAEMALVTQFCFEAVPVIDWADRLAAEDFGIPIHIGVAGPARLQEMIGFAVTCGVGPSLRVLQRRAKDASKLLMPVAPDEFVRELAMHKAANPGFNIERVHFFPLGGIAKTAEWIAQARGSIAI